MSVMFWRYNWQDKEKLSFDFQKTRKLLLSDYKLKLRPWNTKKDIGKNNIKKAFIPSCWSAMSLDRLATTELLQRLFESPVA